jgi:methylated-DNA-[protein]-cysteine S-methyltransferase
MELAQLKVTSPFGALYLVASATGLRGIFFKKQKVKMSDGFARNSAQVKFLKLAERELLNYFLGKSKKFRVKLDFEGTDFQMKVWRELYKIPYGKTISYKELALKVKNPKAVRAVGSANGKNPLCIIIPCHRVIANDGGIGGYSGGLRMKKTLLELEEAYHC